MPCVCRTHRCCWGVAIDSTKNWFRGERRNADFPSRIWRRKKYATSVRQWSYGDRGVTDTIEFQSYTAAELKRWKGSNSY